MASNAKPFNSSILCFMATGTLLKGSVKLYSVYMQKMLGFGNYLFFFQKEINKYQQCFV